MRPSILHKFFLPRLQNSFWQKWAGRQDLPLIWIACFTTSWFAPTSSFLFVLAYVWGIGADIKGGLDSRESRHEIVLRSPCTAATTTTTTTTTTTATTTAPSTQFVESDSSQSSISVNDQSDYHSVQQTSSESLIPRSETSTSVSRISSLSRLNQDETRSWRSENLFVV